MTARRTRTPHLNVFLVQFIKVRVIERVLGRDAILGIVHEESFEQVHAVRVELVGDRGRVRGFEPNRKGRVPILQLRHTGPDVVVGRSELSKDLVELIDFRISGEEWFLVDHFGKDGANGPHVHGRRVGLRAHEDFGRTVPQRHDFVREGANGRTKGARESKVGNLQNAVARHEQILRLEVAVHDAARVAKGQAAAELKEVGLDEGRWEHALAGFHVLFQVLVQKFEDEIEAAVFLDAIFQFDNVAMRQFSEQRNLTKRRGRNAFVFDLQANALERDDFVRDAIARLVDDSVRAFSQVGPWLFNLLVALVKKT